MIGGWQIAGAGSFQIDDFAIASSNWGPTAASGAAGKSLHVYKHGMPITDCTSGTCLKEYEWFNGYFGPSVLAGSYAVNGVPGCAGTSAKSVTGLSTSWAPYQAPLDTYCVPNGSTPTTDKYYNDNDVAMSNVTGVAYPGSKTQANGTVIGYGIVPANNHNGASEGSIDVTNPFAHTVLNGPMNWSVDASLFKVFPVTQSLDVRLNVDAFNLFNNQGLNNPSSTTGETCISAGLTCTSHNTPRQIQLSLRISF